MRKLLTILKNLHADQGQYKLHRSPHRPALPPPALAPLTVSSLTPGALHAVPAPPTTNHFFFMMKSYKIYIFFAQNPPHVPVNMDLLSGHLHILWCIIIVLRKVRVLMLDCK